MPRRRASATAVSRREFLTTTAAAGGVVAALGSAGCAYNAPARGTGVAETSGARQFRLALADAPELASAGGVRHVVYDVFDFFLVRRSETEVIAIRNVCSHKRCATEYDPEAAQFSCPCHGSEFDLDGRPLRGPAEKPLSRYPATLIDDVVQVELTA